MKRAFVVMALLGLLGAPPPVRAQPPAGEVILENLSVHITVQTFAPGGATGRHQGIEPEIGLVVEGELTVETPTGRQVLRPGSAYWMPGLPPHDVRNASGRPARMWDIFLKRCD